MNVNVNVNVKRLELPLLDLTWPELTRPATPSRLPRILHRLGPYCMLKYFQPLQPKAPAAPLAAVPAPIPAAAAAPAPAKKKPAAATVVEAPEDPVAYKKWLKEEGKGREGER
jgi:hypothetical protein